MAYKINSNKNLKAYKNNESNLDLELWTDALAYIMLLYLVKADS